MVDASGMVVVETKNALHEYWDEVDGHFLPFPCLTHMLPCPQDLFKAFHLVLAYTKIFPWLTHELVVSAAPNNVDLSSQIESRLELHGRASFQHRQLLPLLFQAILPLSPPAQA